MDSPISERTVCILNNNLHHSVSSNKRRLLTLLFRISNLQPNQSLRTAEIIATMFNRLYDNYVEQADQWGILEPTLAKIRRAPRRLDDGANAASFDDLRDYFGKNFELVDCTVAAVNSRFNTPGLDVACAVERLLLEGAGGKVNDALLKQVKNTTKAT